MSIERDETRWIYGQKSDDPLFHAFDKRHTIDPRFDIKKPRIPGGDKRAGEWYKLSETVSPDNQTAYFHIPFCETRCSFCRFFQNLASDQSPVDYYTSHLIKDIELTMDSLGKNIKPISAVYFGGGTPTTLSGRNVTDIFEAIKRSLPLADNCEITFEARVSDIGKDTIEACLDNGVNRFSFGVQSFDTKVRRLMSRISSREEVLEKLSDLTANASATISVDLIYGLPNQDEDVWTRDLDALFQTNVDGVDIYQLEDAVLRIRYGANFGKLNLPGISEKAEMYRRASRFFESKGFIRQNNTHWARNKKERNLYTSLTRSGIRIPRNDVLAFGCGAIGKVSSYKYQVNRSLDAYTHDIDLGKKPIEYIEEQSEDTFLDELVPQIDYGEINLGIFTEEYGIDLYGKFKQLIDSYVEDGLVSIAGGLIKLTEAGRFWKSNIALGFVLNRDAS